jgi:L-asparaginase / beta-aspartyl-peptidase
MISYGVVLHGGVGSSTRLSGPCRSIGQKVFSFLQQGRTAMDVVVEAVRLLEDDGRFNAGSGSVLRLDGETVEMDASVMDSGGGIGAVMAVKGVRNPVLLARAVTETPHVALAGEGATLFARRLGLPRPPAVSERVVRRFEKMRRALVSGSLVKKDDRWRATDLERVWNFTSPCERLFSSDTVGAGRHRPIGSRRGCLLNGRGLSDAQREGRGYGHSGIGFLRRVCRRGRRDGHR